MEISVVSGWFVNGANLRSFKPVALAPSRPSSHGLQSDSALTAHDSQTPPFRDGPDRATHTGHALEIFE